MNLPLAVITLAQDQELESLPSGSAQIYWSQASQTQECSGGVQMLVQAEILSLQPPTQCSVRLLGQWSVDGRTWHDFYSPLDGDTADGSGWTTHGNKIFYYGGLPQEYAPFVRFGLMVASSTTDQARARLSASVTILPWAMAASVTMATNVLINADTPTYAYVPIANFRSGVFAVVISDWTSSGTAPVTLQVSPEADPASEAWVDLETFTPPNRFV